MVADVTSEDFTGREAILRDYPLRLWARQQQYTEGLLREFTLLVIGERSGEMRTAAPGALVDLAEMFTTRFAQTLDALASERQAALDAGLDRMESRVPLPTGTPDLLAQAAAVLAKADAFCVHADLLTLPRPPELLAFNDWTITELTRQYEGAEPTPWPGPF